MASYEVLLGFTGRSDEVCFGMWEKVGGNFLWTMMRIEFIGKYLFKTGERILIIDKKNILTTLFAPTL